VVPVQWRRVTARQKRIVLALSIAIALTRFAVVARSFFDWDEALFVSAVREYDVTLHHPHPPGFPIFIGAAKVLHALGIEEFRALQAVVILGACFLFPALFAFARELGFDFATSVLGAAIFCFLPNVWLYGGTAFSDVPATTLVFAACALLLRGRSDPRAYVLGAVVLGISAGVRTTNLMIGAIPAVVATVHQARAKRYRDIAMAIVAGAAIVLASYAAAGLASTGIANFFESLRGQSRYVAEVDSWRNPERMKLGEAAVQFFLHPFQYRDILNALTGAAVLSLIAGLVVRRAAPLLTFAIFAPLAIVAWLQFDPMAAGRYSIAYMAAHAVLGADGFRVLGRRASVQTALSMIILGLFVFSVQRGVREQLLTIPPPVAALRFAAEHVPPDAPLYVHGSMEPHAVVLLRDREPRWFRKREELASAPPDAWVVDEITYARGTNFVREKLGSWKVLRRRNFKASVVRVSEMR